MTAQQHDNRSFTTSIRLRQDVWRALRLHAFLAGRPLAEDLERAIIAYVGPDTLAKAAALFTDIAAANDQPAPSPKTKSRKRTAT